MLIFKSKNIFCILIYSKSFLFISSFPSAWLLKMVKREKVDIIVTSPTEMNPQPPEKMTEVLITGCPIE